MTTPNPIASALLLRRPSTFYVGKVLRLNEQTKPEGWPTGYYRLILITDVPEPNTWHYEYVSDTPPPGEPIYKYDYPGQKDLWAVPSTVWSSKIRNSFFLWAALVVGLWVLAGLMGAFAEPSYGYGDDRLWVNGLNMALLAFGLGSMMCAPFIKWGLEIEPVTTMKIVYTVLIIFAVLNSRAERTGTAARTDQAGREG